VFLITGGGTVNSLIAIAMPEYIHSKTFYNSNDTYKRHYRETHNKEEWEDFKKLSLQEVTKQREEANASAKLHL
jgi:nicotinamide mononucleotide adenylyltransferase